MTEADMCPAVFEWLEAEGLTPYTEVIPPYFGRAVDIVGWDGSGRIVPIELKTSLTRGLVYQGVQCLSLSSEVYCVTASKPKPKGVDMCVRMGLGLVSISSGKLKVISCPAEKRDRLLPYRAEGLIERLGKMRPRGVGGVPFTKGEGPAKAVRRRVFDYLSGNPGASWQKMYEVLDNHYASWRSMKQSQKTLEELMGDKVSRRLF